MRPRVSARVSRYRDPSMLKDPLFLPSPVDNILPTHTTNNAIPYSTEPWRANDFAPGKSVRVRKSTTSTSLTAVDTLTISHTPSKENAPFATTRTLIRLQRQAVTEQGQRVTLSASLTVSSPEVSGVFAAGVDEVELARTLAAFVLYGPVSATTGGTYINSSVPEAGWLPRLLQGEA